MREYTYEELDYKATKMFDYLREATPKMNDEDAVITRLMHLGRMLAESGEYKSAALYKVDEITHGEIAKAIDMALGDKMSVSMANQYIKTACKDWNYLVNAFDRINSASGKIIMALQTIISLEKEKMKIR